MMLGYLSEEGSESNNRIFREIRKKNARKISRKANLTDVVTTLLVRSDPKINRCNRKNLKFFPKKQQPESGVLEILDKSEPNFVDDMIEEKDLEILQSIFDHGLDLEDAIETN